MSLVEKDRKAFKKSIRKAIAHNPKTTGVSSAYVHRKREALNRLLRKDDAVLSPWKNGRFLVIPRALNPRDQPFMQTLIGYIDEAGYWVPQR